MIEVKNNAVLRDGQQIATLESGVCYSYSPLAPVLKGQIKKASGNASLTFELVEVTGKEIEYEGEKFTQIGITTTPDTGGIDRDTNAREVHSRSVEAKGPRTIADLHTLAEIGTIPKPPSTHEALGSRTPAFVQWVKAHLSPEDFEAAYKGRKLPTIEEVEHEFGKLSRTLRQQEEASKDQTGGIRF